MPGISSNTILELSPHALWWVVPAHPIVDHITKLWYESDEYKNIIGHEAFSKLLQSVCDENNLTFFSTNIDVSNNNDLGNSFDGIVFHLVIPEHLTAFLYIKYSE